MNNSIYIAGHLGADPEVRFNPDGKKVTTFRVATRTRVKGNDDTIWWRVTVWGDRFDKMIPHFKKGSAFMAIGEIHKPELFTDREGKSQISLEITAYQIGFSPFGKPTERPAGAPASGYSPQPASQPAGAPASGYSPQPAGASFPPNPYMSSVPGKNPMGTNMDDEVPF